MQLSHISGMKALPVPLMQFLSAKSQKVCAEVVVKAWWRDCHLGSGLKEVMVKNCQKVFQKAKIMGRSFSSGMLGRFFSK